MSDDRHEFKRFEARLTFMRGLQLASDSIVGEYDLAQQGDEGPMRSLLNDITHPID